VGFAINEGYIESVYERMVDYFPEYEVENPSEEKQNINIENLLTMSAGFEWYEMEYPYDDNRNSFYQWIRSNDRIQFVLDLPLTTTPGEAFNYNTGISHVLSAIIQRATGTRTDLFAKEYLFDPLGISDYQWHIDTKNIASGGHGMRLNSRDMAKFAYLYLKHGVWEEEQIVPENWIESSSTAHIQRKYIPDFYYGYHWWVKPNNYYNAVGINGQWMYVVPEYDLVVVFTNNLNEEEYLQVSTPERLLNTYIIPAVKL
jgi:CubicO group peptidase (beta-lactamase class C family)